MHASNAGPQSTSNQPKRTRAITRYHTPRNRIMVRRVCVFCGGRSAYWNMPNEDGSPAPTAQYTGPYQLCHLCDQLGMNKRGRGAFRSITRHRRNYYQRELAYSWRGSDEFAEIIELDRGYDADRYR
jgi:hypothetical protein